MKTSTPRAGTRLLHYNVGLTFTTLARRAGLAGRSGGCRPRPHDLRHSFAVATLLDWCRDGGDIASDRILPSPRWPAAPDWPAAPAAAVPGRMICGIHLRSPRSWTGAVTAVTSHPGCRCCRPTSATPTRPAPTGTCTPPPNCLPRPPAGSAPHRENPGDRDRRDHAGILHRLSRGRRYPDTRTERAAQCGRRLPPERDNSQAVEEREEMVRWLIVAGSATWRSGAVERALLQFKIGAKIDQGGLDRFVAEP